MWRLQPGSYSKLCGSPREPRVSWYRMKGHDGWWVRSFLGHFLSRWDLVSGTSDIAPYVKGQGEKWFLSIFMAVSALLLRNHPWGWAGGQTGCVGLCKDGQSPSRDSPGWRNRGSVLWTGLSFSQSGFPGALRAWVLLGDGGGWSQCPGTPQLQHHPIASGPLAALKQDTVGCGRKDPKAAKQICSYLAGSDFSYLYKRPKHLRSFRENRAVLLIHLPQW